MLKSKINKLFLACILTLFSSSVAETNKQTYHIDQNNWNAFIDKFIKSSQTQAQTKTNKMIQISGSLGLGMAFWILLSSILRGITTSQVEYTQGTAADPAGLMYVNRGLFFNKLGLFLASLPSFFVIRYEYKKMYEWILAREEQKAIKNYIENWQVNQRTAPIKLHHFLNSIYEKFKENPNEVDFAETSRIVKALVINAQKTNN